MRLPPPRGAAPAWLSQVRAPTISLALASATWCTVCVAISCPAMYACCTYSGWVYSIDTNQVAGRAQPLRLRPARSSSAMTAGAVTTVAASSLVCTRNRGGRLGRGWAARASFAARGCSNAVRRGGRLPPPAQRSPAQQTAARLRPAAAGLLWRRTCRRGAGTCPRGRLQGRAEERRRWVVGGVGEAGGAVGRPWTPAAPAIGAP